MSNYNQLWENFLYGGDQLDEKDHKKKHKNRKKDKKKKVKLPKDQWKAIKYGLRQLPNSQNWEQTKLIFKNMGFSDETIAKLANIVNSNEQEINEDEHERIPGYYGDQGILYQLQRELGDDDPDKTKVQAIAQSASPEVVDIIVQKAQQAQADPVSDEEEDEYSDYSFEDEPAGETGAGAAEVAPDSAPDPKQVQAAGDAAEEKAEDAVAAAAEPIMQMAQNLSPNAQANVEEKIKNLSARAGEITKSLAVYKLRIPGIESEIRTLEKSPVESGKLIAQKQLQLKKVKLAVDKLNKEKEKLPQTWAKLEQAVEQALAPQDKGAEQELPPEAQLNEKDDRCTRIAKRKYDVWPSAYASGAVVKCRQGKIWKGLKEAEEGIEEKIRQALRDEGGAAGMDALKKHVGKSQRIIVQAIEDMDDVGRHADGDYILQDGEEVDIVDEKKLTKAEKKKREEIAKAIEKDEPNMPMDKKMAIATATAKRVAESDDELEEKKKKKRRKKRKKGYGMGAGYMFDAGGDGGDGGGMEEDLKKWFGRKGAKGSASGWVDCNSPDGKGGYKACGRQEGEKRKKYPACRPTPAACKQKGKGKKWGKKGGKKKQESITNDQINEMVQDFIAENLLGNGLRHHIKEGIPVHQNLYRVGTPCYFNMLRQARNLDRLGLYETQNEEELYYLRETELGEWAMFEGERVPLDFPMYIEDVNEKKDPPIGKPTKNTGGGKKYKVYVRNPKTGNVKKITYGDAKGGLKGNWNNAEARKSFAARHDCENKKDRTKAGYWACRAHKDFGKNVPGRFW
jgi:hypothetical protein